MIRAPSSRACAANSAKYSGVACGKIDALAGEAREPDVRERRERLAAPRHALDRAQRRLEPDAVIGADRGDVELCERGRGLFGGDAAERLRVLVEREQADDGQPRHAADGSDRRDQLVELVERLDHEEVDAAAFQQRRLLGEDRLALLRRPAERADRAGDEDVRAGDLARVPRNLHRRLVHRGDVVLEVVLRELAAVGSERVRLDHVRAGPDEAEVEREHALGRPQVRLLGAAEARHRARDERAHSSVAHEGWAGCESLDEAAHGVIPARGSAGASHAVKRAGQHPRDRSSLVGCRPRNGNRPHCGHSRGRRCGGKHA